MSIAKRLRLFCTVVLDFELSLPSCPRSYGKEMLIGRGKSSGLVPPPPPVLYTPLNSQSLVLKKLEFCLFPSFSPSVPPSSVVTGIDSSLPFPAAFQIIGPSTIETVLQCGFRSKHLNLLCDLPRHGPPTMTHMYLDFPLTFFLVVVRDVLPSNLCIPLFLTASNTGLTTPSI